MAATFAARPKRGGDESEPAARRRAPGVDPMRQVMNIPGLVVKLGSNLENLGALAAASRGFHRSVQAARALERPRPHMWVAAFVAEFKRLRDELERWCHYPAAGSAPPQPMQLPQPPSLDAVLLYFQKLDDQQRLEAPNKEQDFWSRLPMLDTSYLGDSKDASAEALRRCASVPGGTQGLARLCLYERTAELSHLTQAPIFMLLSARLTRSSLSSLHDGALEAGAALYRFLIVPDLLTPEERESSDFSGMDFELFYHDGSLPMEKGERLIDHIAELEPKHMRWDWVLSALASPNQAAWEQMRTRLIAAPA